MPAPNPPIRAWMSWSSGKDSTFALAAARTDPELEVVGLLVTVNAEADRVAMHAVRRTLLEAQAERLGLPLHVVEIPSPCPNDVYAAKMGAAMHDASAAGVRPGRLRRPLPRGHPRRTASRRWPAPASNRCSRSGAVRPTRSPREMIASGIRAVLTCVDPQPAAGRVRRARVRRVAPRRPPGRRRPVRRERRVPHVRLGRARVLDPDRRRGRRGRRAGRVRLLRRQLERHTIWFGTSPVRMRASTRASGSHDA